MTHTPRLIHTGQALVDVLVDVPHLPRRGGNVMATSYTRHAGGAVNILVAAARSGGQAVHAGAIGTGPNGDLISTTLAEEGVAMSAARVPDADTGVCLVLLDPSAERTFITTTGAERAVSIDSFGTSSPRPGDMVCVTGYSLALPATRDPLLAWLDTLPAGVGVVLDPGAVFAELDESVRTHMIDHTTVWTGNAEESAALGGVGDMVGSCTPAQKGCAPVPSSSPATARRDVQCWLMDRPARSPAFPSRRWTPMVQATSIPAP